MPVIEWSINIGTVVALFFAIAGFYWVTKSDMSVMKENIVAIKEDLKELNKVTKEIAVQDKRIDNQGEIIASLAKQTATLENRMFDLSRGRGFIRQELDGSYPP